MKIEHVFLELFTNDDIDVEELVASHKLIDELHEGTVKYAIAEHELSYAGKNGIVWDIEDSIGFGGDMDAESSLTDYEEMNKILINEWHKISQKKIDEAYEEYMQVKRQILKAKTEK
ncbi:hypothetical protein [Enterococcus sp. LJL51]|uniref:hypothetical protein n=1 Tax=Enterococcus sp. LJL51 TaxID=3416656 RepID=UPI003CEB2139